MAQVLWKYGKPVNLFLAIFGLRLSRVANRLPPPGFPHAGFKAYHEDMTKRAQLLSIAVLNSQGDPSSTLDVAEPIVVEVDLIIRELITDMNLSFMIHEPVHPRHVSATHTAMTQDVPTNWPAGKHRVQMEFPAGVLNRGTYYIRAGFGGPGAHIGTAIDSHFDDGLTLEITVAGEVTRGSIHSHGLLAVMPTFRRSELLEPVDRP